MRNLILSILFLLFFLNNGFSQFESEGIRLLIEKSLENENSLVFTLINDSEKDVVTDQFNHSNINKVDIIAPNGKKANYDIIICHTMGYVTLKPQEKRWWELNLSEFFYPFVSREIVKGEYKIYWTVNGNRSSPYIYVFR
jgi:hypothetical protein